ncbi:MAG: DUF5522 domain-containing protein [bacterium]|nr:DUF5522 domain-containing protein [bacterium]
MKKCCTCENSFECSGDSSCWCSDLPNILELEKAGDCQCPDCLKKNVSNAIDDFVTKFKAGAVENLAPAYNTSPPSFVEGIDYYLQNGAWVFREWAHLKRGFCCGNGCRHCPYPK